MKTVLDFLKMKTQGQKISMVTCYDYTSARIVSAPMRVFTGARVRASAGADTTIAPTSRGAATRSNSSVDLAPSARSSPVRVSLLKPIRSTLTE